MALRFFFRADPPGRVPPGGPPGPARRRSRFHSDDPKGAPLRGEVAGLPPAVVVTADFDPLRDEGIAYFRLLQRAGVPVVGRVNLGLTHGADMAFRAAIPEAYTAAVRDIRGFAGALSSRK